MKYRTATILSEKALDASGTEIAPIRIQDKISRIMLGYRAKRQAIAMSAHLGSNIERIELVDGSDVLFALTGEECIGLNIFDRRILSSVHSQYMGGNSMFVPLCLDFGRWLWDTELALDPAQFDNLMLKITYDTTNFDADATLNYLGIYAECFDEKAISPVGFLMTKEHWKKTMVQDTYEYIALPTDFPIRQLIIRSHKESEAPWYTVREVRIDEDNEKRIPFNWDVENYYRMRKAEDLPIIEATWEYARILGDAILYVTPTDYLAAAAGMGTGTTQPVYRVGNLAGGEYAPANSGGQSASSILFGWLPCHCIQFPFGYQKDLDDWYDVTAKGSVRLRLRGGDNATLGTGQVVLQQLRRY